MRFLKIFLPALLIVGFFAGPSISQDADSPTGPSIEDQRAAEAVGFLMNYGSANDDATAYFLAGKIASEMRGANFAIRGSDGEPANVLSLLETAVELAGTDSDIGQSASALIASLTDASQTEEDYYLWERVYYNNYYCDWYYWYDDWGYYLGYEVFCY